VRIEKLRSEKNGGRKRVAATVIWEDCDRPVHELSYETDEEFEKDLTCNPNGFLVACIMPAFCHGEKRVFIDAEICPQLQEGLITAMALIKQWWYHNRPDMLTRIEAKTSVTMLTPTTDRRAGMMFSGGIDSLATLRKNRLTFPLEHPWSIKDGVLVFGLETDDLKKFEYVKRSLSHLGKEAGFNLIPVYTNVRYLDDDWMFWQRKFQDSVYASVAHLFSQRLSVVSIASTNDIANLQPDGSHPLLDINYSSSDVLIRHDAVHLTRLDKLKLVADWDLGFQNIRTCNKSDLYESDFLNCGRCWKCVSAMLAFMGLGVLEKTRAFPPENITGELVESVVQIDQANICIYEELPPLLIRKGRHDLAKIIERKIDASQKIQEKGELRTLLTKKIKRLDKKYLNGKLRKSILKRRDKTEVVLDGKC